MQRRAATCNKGAPPTSPVAQRLLWATLLALACLLAAPLSAAAISTNGSVTMVSEGGDYIGGGTDRLFNTPVGTLSISGGLGHVEVSASGEAGSFTFDFAPPSGGQLEVGEYTGAQRYPFEPAGSPGLAVSGDGRGCNHDYGRFIVKDIHVDGSGNVDRFWVLYEQHCESPDAPALFGEVRVGEPATGAPEAAEPAAIDWPSTPVGSSTVQVPVTVVGGEGGADVTTVGLVGENAGDFGVSSDGCSGTVLAAGARCDLEVRVRPTSTGARTAQLVITDKSGAKTTVPLAVFATPAIAPPIGFPPSPPSPPPTAPVSNPPTTAASPLPAAGGPQPPHLQITPARPRAGRPDVYVELGAVRVVLVSFTSHAVLGYRYFFSARGIRCIDGGTNVVFTIVGTRHTAPCRASLILISGQVAAHNTYTIRVQAVKMHGRRVVKWGASYSGRLYMPGNEARWNPIAQLPPSV
jgi:hypothetical protein